MVNFLNNYQCYQLGRSIGKRPIFRPLEPIGILPKSAADFLPIEILEKLAEFQPFFLKIWPDLAEFWPFLAVITFHKGQFLADFENFSFCRFCRFFFELKPIFGKKELATLTITLYVHYPFSMHGANVNLRELESSDFKKAIKIFIQISNHHIM